MQLVFYFALWLYITSLYVICIQYTLHRIESDFLSLLSCLIQLFVFKTGDRKLIFPYIYQWRLYRLSLPPSSWRNHDSVNWPGDRGEGTLPQTLTSDYTFLKPQLRLAETLPRVIRYFPMNYISELKMKGASVCQEHCCGTTRAPLTPR